MASTFFALFLGTLMGFIPTFGLLFLITNRYERTIHEEDTMKTFILGIFAGILVTLGHLYVVNSFDPASEGGTSFFLISAYLLALAEALIWRIYIRRKKFRQRPDRPFIVLSFSLGISGLFLLFTSGQMFVNFEVASDRLLGFFLFAIAVSLMRASMSLFLSRGEMKNRYLKQFVLITLMFGTFNFVSMVYIGFGFLWTFALILVIPALGAFWYFYRDLEKVEQFNPER